VVVKVASPSHQNKEWRTQQKLTWKRNRDTRLKYFNSGSTNTDMKGNGQLKAAKAYLFKQLLKHDCTVASHSGILLSGHWCPDSRHLKLGQSQSRLLLNHESLVPEKGHSTEDELFQKRALIYAAHTLCKQIGLHTSLTPLTWGPGGRGLQRIQDTVSTCQPHSKNLQ
jgi:hypothetical protein